MWRKQSIANHNQFLLICGIFWLNLFAFFTINICKKPEEIGNCDGTRFAADLSASNPTAFAIHSSLFERRSNVAEVGGSLHAVHGFGNHPGLLLLLLGW